MQIPALNHNTAPSANTARAKWTRAIAALVISTAVVAIPATSTWAQSSGGLVSVDSDAENYAGNVTVPINKSRILRVSQPVKELMVGNSEIADVMPLTDRSVYVLGKQLGSTSLSIYGANKQLIAVVDLKVSHDTRGLKRDLYEIMPEEKIEVRAANDSIVLSGSVTSSRESARAAGVAERYAPEKVSNFLGVKQSEQVMLAVRFAEVKRSAAKELGLKTDVLWNNDDTTLDFASGFLNPEAFASLLGNFVIGQSSVDIMLDALETRGVITTLAEPTLVAMSGETASFLAGGEFPVPVARDTDDSGTTITVEFKEFGVSLAFTPTVNGDFINMMVAPEVSALDPRNKVEFGGFSIPALTTRRAETTVELRNGQSFAIAGLLQSEFADGLSQVPGIGNIPIIGSLFRSSDFQRDETELVIIITPYLVAPVDEDELAAPTDYFVRPHELELFLAGVTETSGAEPGTLGLMAGTQNMASVDQGGLDGSLGYIVE